MNHRNLKRDKRGAIYVEHLIAYLPVMFFFLATWQLIELCAAHLILKRAASAAARAAVVVLPDDPAFYGGVPENEYSGQRARDVRLAASLILANNPHFASGFGVKITGNSGKGPLTAEVSANFHCFAGWVSLVCGGATRRLTAKSINAYHGADYKFDL
jgi:hypothetical protein